MPAKPKKRIPKVGIGSNPGGAPRTKDEALLRRFAARLDKLREARGMSLRQLAAQANCTASALVFIAKGADVSLSRAVWLARALGVPLAELISPD